MRAFAVARGIWHFRVNRNFEGMKKKKGRLHAQAARLVSDLATAPLLPGPTDAHRVSDPPASPLKH